MVRQCPTTGLNQSAGHINAALDRGIEQWRCTVFVPERLCQVDSYKDPSITMCHIQPGEDVGPMSDELESSLS